MRDEETEMLAKTFRVNNFVQIIGSNSLLVTFDTKEKLIRIYDWNLNIYNEFSIKDLFIEMDDQVCLIFSQYDGIIDDLKCILKSFVLSERTTVFPNDKFNLKKETSESKNQKSIEEFQFHYEKDIENEIKTSKIVIFIATNDSIKSEKCIKLIQLTKKMNIPISSLIVEEIKILDGIKSTILSDIDHHFEVYKDRVHTTGYDQCMWLGERFQNFVNHINLLLNINIRTSKKKNSKDYYISYLLSSNTSPKKIGNIIKILGWNSSKFNFNLKKANTSDENLVKVKTCFDYYDYELKSAHVDKDVEYYASIIRIFDDIVQNNIVAEKKKGQFYRGNLDYGFIYTHIENIVGFCEIKEETTKFLKEELEKKGVDIDLLNNIFGLLHFNHQNDYIYNELMESKTIVFLLTKEYYESKKFQKIFYEAKRWEKNIFLVKLEEFEFKINVRYENIYIHDISKHENNDYEGYFTRNLLVELRNCFKIDNTVLKYNVWYELFIYCSNNHKIESIQKIRKVFEEQNLRIKCKFDYTESEERMNEIKDDMEKSKIVVFCLDNHYLESGEFQNDFDYVKTLEKPVFFNKMQSYFNLAKTQKKPVLFLLMEDICSSFHTASFDLQSFNAIEFYKIDSIFKGEIFYRLCYFVYSLLYSKQSRVSFEDDGEVKLQPIDSEYQSKKYALFKNSPISKRGKLIKEIQIDKYDELMDVAYIKHLNVYIFVRKYGCYFNDADFNYTHQYIHPEPEEPVNFLLHPDANQIQYNSVLYDEKNENIYLEYVLNDILYLEKLNDKMQFIKKRKMRALFGSSSFLLNNDQIFVVEAHAIEVFDLNLELVCDLKFPEFNFWQIHVEQRCKNYVYFFNNKESINVAFNMIGFNVNENMFSRHDYISYLCSNFSNNLCFQCIKSENSKIEIFEIEYNKSYDDAISPSLKGFVCQLNAYPPHLLKHPNVLPCGSLACLECIYENYNLYLNKFICAACGNNEHQQLKNQIEKSTLIEDNLRKISETQLEHLKENLESHASIKDKYENLENILKFIEEDIEIRFESLKIKIDEHAETQIQYINKLEQKLLKTSLKPCKKSFRLTDYNNKQDISKILSNCPCRKFFHRIDKQKRDSNFRDIEEIVGILEIDKKEKIYV